MGFFLIIIIFCFVFFLLACIYNTTSARCRILTRICWRLLCSNLSTATHMVISRFAKCVHLIKYVSSKKLQIFDFRTFNLWHYVRVLFFTCVELSRLNASFYINRQQKITIMEILRHYWTHQLDGWKLKKIMMYHITLTRKYGLSVNRSVAYQFCAFGNYAFFLGGGSFSIYFVHALYHPLTLTVNIKKITCQFRYIFKDMLVFMYLPPRTGIDSCIYCT